MKNVTLFFLFRKEKQYRVDIQITVFSFFQRNCKKPIKINETKNEWKIPVIKSDKNGNSFVDYKVYRLNDKEEIGSMSDPIKVQSSHLPKKIIFLIHFQFFKSILRTGIKLRETPGDYNFDWHCAPNKQFIINLDAAVHIRTSNGQQVLLEQGQLFAVEDIDGKGHQSRAVDGMPRKSVFIVYE
ncbi:hypothetical protein RFI_12681 [Reticulomyxa filosa]|uniref:Uncharacterized protein n=1 Tax=Reticulomyxa filosa TaxID=46433 RepID=X6N8H7_RETFI|nr:hypothetical protein RFI_15590 [Reticulomyxa filosa]ETO24475.1 hypothetical protein RFI_12681 [Reticulomyxa filosa]|eukprot:ETO21612.1 hypothetical protein RFI_15590 [Reticulomyxa filosa]